MHNIITNKLDYEQVELILMEHLNAQNDPKQQTKCSGSKSQSCSCSQTLDVKPPKGPVVEKIEKFTLAWDSEESNPNEPDVSDGKEVETVPVEQLPDSELPGKSANTSYIQVFFFGLSENFDLLFFLNTKLCGISLFRGFQNQNVHWIIYKIW